MKKFFSLFVVAGMLVIAAVVFYLNHHSEAQVKEMRDKLAQVKAKYNEAAQALRTSGTPDEYMRDQNDLLKKYQAELEKVAKIDPALLDLDAEKKKFQVADQKKAPSAEQRTLREEYFNLTKNTYQLLMSGQYKPAMTGTSSGARVDILSMKRVTMPTGEAALRAEFIGWGFPPEVAWGDINMRGWVAKEEEVKGKKKKGTGETVDEIKYKFDASSARPTIAINNPERWVLAFPPGATIGYYYLQLLPRDAVRLDLSFHYKMTNADTGRIVNVDVAFDDLAVPDAWMLPEGAKFQATERESSDNERRGRGEDEEPPAKAKAAKK